MKLPQPVDRTWNVTWSNDGYTSDKKGILVTYPKGEFASASAASFRAAPPAIFPCRAATLSYRVALPDSFDWKKGGKLPGLFAGAAGAGGGNWNDDGASCRVMWREGGEVVAYTYMATDSGNYDGTASCPLVRAQGKGFDAIAHHTNGAGVDLWRGEGLQLRRGGAANEVSVSMALNSPGKADGVVSLTVNGKTKRFEGMRWCKNPRMQLTGVAFASWFGGGSKDYAPSSTQRALFSDVDVSIFSPAGK